MVRAKREAESSSPPLSVLDTFSPYHVQSWGASSKAASNISNGYQLGEGENVYNTTILIFPCIVLITMMTLNIEITKLSLPCLLNQKAKKLNYLESTKGKAKDLNSGYKTKAEAIGWRRNKIIELKAQGIDQTEIARVLQVSPATITCDYRICAMELCRILENTQPMSYLCIEDLQKGFTKRYSNLLKTFTRSKR